MESPNAPEQAITEIRAVLDKYDLAGLAVVSSADHVAFLRKIDPSWSCAWMTPPEPDGKVGVRIRAKLAEYPSLEAQKKTVEATTGMFMAFMNWSQETFDNMTAITAMLAKHFPEILHKETWKRSKW